MSLAAALVMTLVSAGDGVSQAEQLAAQRGVATKFHMLIDGVVEDLRTPGSWLQVAPHGAEAEALQLVLAPVVVHDLKAPFLNFAQALDLAVDELQRELNRASGSSSPSIAFVEEVLQAVGALRKGFEPVAAVLEALRGPLEQRAGGGAILGRAIQDGPFGTFVKGARQAAADLGARADQLPDSSARATSGPVGSPDDGSPFNTVRDVLDLVAGGAAQLDGQLLCAMDLESRLSQAAQPQPGGLLRVLDFLARQSNVLVAVRQPRARRGGGALALSKWEEWRRELAPSSKGGRGSDEASVGSPLLSAVAGQGIEHSTLLAALRALLTNAREAAGGSGPSFPALAARPGQASDDWRTAAGTATRLQGQVALVVAEGPTRAPEILVINGGEGFASAVLEELVGGRRPRSPKAGSSGLGVNAAAQLAARNGATLQIRAPSSASSDGAAVRLSWGITKDRRAGVPLH